MFVSGSASCVMLPTNPSIADVLDIAAVAAIRDALPDAVLYADANRGWTRSRRWTPGTR